MNSTTTTQETVIMPPMPPVAGDNDFTPGEFAYACDCDRSYLRDAFQVITRNEWWRPFKESLQTRGVDHYTGFQFSNDALYNKIMNAIGSTAIGGGHSGSSMGATMRVMQTIALEGEAEYRRQCIEYQSTRAQRQQQALLARQAEEARLQMEIEAQRRRYEESYVPRNVVEVQSILRRLLASDNNTTTESVPQHMETTVEETIAPSENTDPTIL
jgi:hypothetical protein